MIKINYFQLCLGISLNVLVVITALIIYHEVFQKDRNANFPNTTMESETLPMDEEMPQ